MSDIAIVTIKRHPEEAARNGVFWERDRLHELVNEKECPGGEVFIADDTEHLVADTQGVRQAVHDNRLVVVTAGEAVSVAGDDIKATDDARALAEQAGIDLVDVTPSGKDGQITKSDVKREIRRLHDDDKE